MKVKICHFYYLINNVKNLSNMKKKIKRLPPKNGGVRKTNC